MKRLMKYIEKIIRLLRTGGEIQYIGGSESLPAPLSPEDEAYYIQRYTGKENDIKQILIEHNLRLVVYIAKKFENTGIDIEDLISIGTIGLIKSVNTFRADKKTKLATYASRCIENEILMYLRKSVNQRSEISIDEPLNTDWDGNELLLSDILGTEPDHIVKKIEDEVERDVLLEAVQCLPKRDRQIICMRFGIDDTDSKTQKEVADILGISQSYISRLEKRIISKLRKDMLRRM